MTRKVFKILSVLYIIFDTAFSATKSILSILACLSLAYCFLQNISCNFILFADKGDLFESY